MGGKANGWRKALGVGILRSHVGRRAGGVMGWRARFFNGSSIVSLCQNQNAKLEEEKSV